MDWSGDRSISAISGGLFPVSLVGELTLSRNFSDGESFLPNFNFNNIAIFRGVVVHFIFCVAGFSGLQTEVEKVVDSASVTWFGRKYLGKHHGIGSFANQNSSVMVKSNTLKRMQFFMCLYCV